MIELNEVTKVYPDGTQAVRGVSLSVDKGEFCILLGPSGCGKTTLLKLINRLIPLTSGKISIEGVDIQSLDPIQLRRHIGYAIQEVGLFPHLTVRENILIVPKLLRWPKDKQLRRAYELCELMGLIPPEDFLKKYPAQLSGGQRQRVGVARALGADPPILLMDEPFGALDPITREKLQDEFRRVQAEIRKTIIFVTHDVNEAIKMGDRIALLREGKLIQYATPLELLLFPRDDFVRNFVGADRVLKALGVLRVREAMDPQAFKREVKQTLAQSVEDSLAREVYFPPSLNQKYAKTELEHVALRWAAVVTPNTPLNEAIATMLEKATECLAVVEEGRLVGLCTFEKVLEVLRECYKYVAGSMGVDE